MLDGSKLEQLKKQKLAAYCRNNYNLSTNINNFQSSAYKHAGNQSISKIMKFGEVNQRFIKGDGNDREPIKEEVKTVY